MNDKEKFILLLCCELVLLCCVCNCEFKYLQDGYIGNTNTICHQTLLYTDGNTDRLYITYGYTDKIYLSVYSRDHENCSPSPWHYSRYSLHTGIPTECVRWYILETMGICLSVYSKDHENCSLLNAMIINDLLTVHFFTDGIKSHR